MLDEINPSPAARRILLVNVNHCTTPDPVFPLGLSFVGAALRQAGFQTFWWDCQLEGQSLERAILESRPHFVGISVRNVDDILIGTRESFWSSVTSACALIRRTSDSPIILGGSGFSIFPRQLLERTGADFGICGEGEVSLISLLQALESKGRYQGISGLVYRDGGCITINPQTSTVSIPNLAPVDRPASVAQFYLNASRMLNVQTQRGCPLQCAYCTYPLIEGPVSRRREAAAVAEEMVYLRSLGVRYVFIVDSVFNSTPAHVQEICDAILQRDVPVHWGCFLRPDGLDANLMRLMARAGLRHIEFGTDSFCDEVLRDYGKRFTFDDVRHASVLANREKIDYCHFLICGGPGESKATLERSFENSRQLPGATVMAVVGMRIYPGTLLAHRAITEEKIDPSEDLLPPTYYLADGLTVETIFAQLRHFAQRSSIWIPGAPAPGLADFARRLRQRGVVGPLWNLFPSLQRLAPAG